MQTITGLFDSHNAARQAVNELEATGIAPSDIRMTANNKDNHWDAEIAPKWTSAGTTATIGAVLGGGAGFFAGLGMLAIPGLGSVAVAGWLVATATGAVAGAAAGGMVGALTDPSLNVDDARICTEGARRGGTLLAARVDDSLSTTVRAILLWNGAVDIDLKSARNRQSHWTELDQFASPDYWPQADSDRAHVDHTHHADRMRS
ncbi:hypothetical protein SAMN05444161_9062 [Rhizobiales bacterium GAS191]|nr:hypothetical protein SAMN05444161_9062 [Rhizobiales bacterium GAS191]